MIFCRFESIHYLIFARSTQRIHQLFRLCHYLSPRAHLHVVGMLRFMFFTQANRACPPLFFFCSCVYFCLYGPFTCISFHNFSGQLPADNLLRVVCLFVALTNARYTDSLRSGLSLCWFDKLQGSLTVLLCLINKLSSLTSCVVDQICTVYNYRNLHWRVQMFSLP